MDFTRWLIVLAAFFVAPLLCSFIMGHDEFWERLNQPRNLFKLLYVSFFTSLLFWLLLIRL